MKTHHVLSFVLLLFPVSLAAQAPRTMSYQGYLTTPGGNPVDDATRSMTFKLYRSASTSTSIWTETQSVATTDGVFNVLLGDTTPLDNVSFDQLLWLGVKVGSDPEIAPRTRLTSVPAAMTLVMPLKDTLRVMTSDLGTDGSEGLNQQLTVHAFDAHLGLYSNPAGVAGSGVQLGEIGGGSLNNKWSMYRETSGAGASLLFTYGFDPRYSQNPVAVEFTPSGRILAANDMVTAGDFEYDAPKTRTLHLPAANFRLAGDEDLTGTSVDWRQQNGYLACYSCVLGGETFTAAVALPHGAEVMSIKLYYMDNDAVADTEFELTIKRRALLSSGTASMGSSPVTTSGASVSVKTHTLDTSANAFRVIDNDTYMYWAELDFSHVTSASWSARRFYGMTIEYKTPRPWR